MSLCVSVCVLCVCCVVKFIFSSFGSTVDSFAVCRSEEEGIIDVAAMDDDVAIAGCVMFVFVLTVFVLTVFVFVFVLTVFVFVFVGDTVVGVFTVCGGDAAVAADDNELEHTVDAPK